MWLLSLISVAAVSTSVWTKIGYSSYYSPESLFRSFALIWKTVGRFDFFFKCKRDELVITFSLIGDRNSNWHGIWKGNVFTHLTVE